MPEATSPATIRWGIAATGGIATGFATDLALVEGAVITAVGSRSQDRADEFGARFDIPHRHPSYEALAADPDVDVVYVASPHSRHAADAIVFLDAGKHVLCEKPMALNELEVVSMIDAARRNSRFLMEAILTRFTPAYVEMRRLLAGGAIGTPLAVDAEFGMPFPHDPAHRLFDKALGGGALLDLGIYPLQLATMVLGPAVAVAAVGHMGVTDVDEQVIVSIRHEAGGLSVSKAASRVLLGNTARISGTDGSISLPAMFQNPKHFTLVSGGETSQVDAQYDGIGLRFGAAEVHRCLAAGELESSVLPLAESSRLAAIMDEARRQIGVRYPADA